MFVEAGPEKLKRERLGSTHWRLVFLWSQWWWFLWCLDGEGEPGKVRWWLQSRGRGDVLTPTSGFVSFLKQKQRGQLPRGLLLSLYLCDPLGLGAHSDFPVPLWHRHQPHAHSSSPGHRIVGIEQDRQVWLDTFFASSRERKLENLYFPCCVPDWMKSQITASKFSIGWEKANLASNILPLQATFRCSVCAKRMKWDVNRSPYYKTNHQTPPIPMGGLIGSLTITEVPSEKCILVALWVDLKSWDTDVVFLNVLFLKIVKVIVREHLESPMGTGGV